MKYGNGGRYRLPSRSRAGVGAQHLGLFAQFAGVGRQPGLRQHVPPPVGLDQHVADLGVDRDGLVRRQGPRRRRPDQQVGTGEIACRHRTTWKPTVSAGSCRLW